MKKYTLPALVVMLGVLICAYRLGGPDSPKTAEQAEVAAPLAIANSQGSPSAPQTRVDAPQVTAVAPTSARPALPNTTDRPAILESIHLASISYDPVELPRIQPFLTHPDPEIRAAALNGMIILGHAAGAPLLREAARRLSPTEAAELLKKADYLELPSATLIERKK